MSDNGTNSDAFDAELITTIKELNTEYSPKLSNLSPSNLRLSTMTVSYKTNMSYCDLSDMDSFLPHLLDGMTVSKPKGKNGNMLNCLIFKIQLTKLFGDAVDADLIEGNDGNQKKSNNNNNKRKKKAANTGTANVSIMLFVNGALNITGCKSVADARLAGLILCSLLDVVNEDCVGTTKLMSFNVQMINSNFETATPLYLDKIHSVLIDR